MFENMEGLGKGLLIGLACLVVGAGFELLL